MDEKQLAAYIDHTLLKAEATSEQIRKLCQEAASYGFCCVSIQQRWIPLAKELLKNTKVKVGAVISLPLGQGLNFAFGDFVGVIVDFLIVALVVFIIARYSRRMGL